MGSVATGERTVNPYDPSGSPSQDYWEVEYRPKGPFLTMPELLHELTRPEDDYERIAGLISDAA